MAVIMSGVMLIIVLTYIRLFIFQNKNMEGEKVQDSVSEEQAIRMVVRQADGTEQEQTVPVSALRSVTAGQNNSSKTTLMTADGQEITIEPSANAGSGPATTLMTTDGQEFTLGGEETLQMMANIAEQTANGGEGNQVSS